ncbi:MAG TPA: hypothetical protein VM802_07040, partial [Chitinophaga sp.]|uniref:helix-turn-helix transcriptional regulator n=1 Tax=Chitinophaga sp. TaxID=1869181 RepID=UPI002BD89FA5
IILFSQQQAQRQQQLQMTYETELKETRIAELEKTKRSQRIILVLIILIAALVTAALILSVLFSRLRQRLNRSERQKMALEASRLKTDLAYRDRELASITLFQEEKSKALTEVKEQVRKASLSADAAALKGILRSIDKLSTGEGLWDTWVLHFKNVHPGFFTQLLKAAPNLTLSEQKHCAYLKMGLGQKEVAQLMGIEPDSVKVARFRIKKKLGLDSEEKLTQFINGIG